VPDLDHFRGSFGARAVIPLWCDAAATRANVASHWLDELSGAYGFAVGADDLMAYCYALLGTRSYVARFADELRIPGPRIPITRDKQLFLRARALGGRLLEVHTYQRVPVGSARLIAPIGEAYPRTFGFDAAAEILSIGQGSIGPMSSAVWGYSVSGLPIVRSWLARRLKPRGRHSLLDSIMPRTWTAPLTHALFELVWLLEETLRLEPMLDVLMAEVVSGSCRDAALV
jgi:hypothetical protein